MPGILADCSEGINFLKAKALADNVFIQYELPSMVRVFNLLFGGTVIVIYTICTSQLYSFTRCVSIPGLGRWRVDADSTIHSHIWFDVPCVMCHILFVLLCLAERGDQHGGALRNSKPICVWRPFDGR